MKSLRGEILSPHFLPLFGMRGMEKWGASFGYAPQENVEAIIADARAAVPQVKAVLYFESQGDPLLRLLTPLPSDEQLACQSLSTR